MITLKIKYKTDILNTELILKYIKQYTSCYHIAYNRYIENYKQKDIEAYLKKMNNIDLMNSWFIKCAAYQIKMLSKDKKIIFGGKNNYINRLKNNITNKQYKLNRLIPIYSGGESNHKGNRFFQINENFNIVFKPNRQTKIVLNLSKQHNYNKFIQKLYQLQNCNIPIGYKLDTEYVYINIDEKIFKNNKKYKHINNRILSIDMNPNYIGWCILDWKTESQFNIVKTGIYSIKDLNDYDNKLKLASNNKKKKHINNKRKNLILNISKKLINLCLYYKCQIFSIEDLNIKTGDTGKGKKKNKLINNQWIRQCFENSIQKYCVLFDIKLLKVLPQYSSFIGNFLFRSLNLPDPVLASIEISRRGYEFYNQYIIKTKQIKKNIIQPEIGQFRDFYIKSLEEFNIEDNQLDFKKLYYIFKKFKLKYKLSIEQFKNLQFSIVFSNKHFIKQVYNNYKNNKII